MKVSKEVLKLKIALGHYTDATDVQSFGYEELRDNGEGARKALGFGEHAANCAWPNGYTSPEVYNEETGEWSESVFVGGEHCTCGLQDTINAYIAVWIKALDS